jgi:hypothetical protein
MGFEKRFLNEVAGVDLALEASADLHAGEECQVVFVMSEERAGGGFAASAGLVEKGLGVVVVADAAGHGCLPGWCFAWEHPAVQKVAPAGPKPPGMGKFTRV